MASHRTRLARLMGLLGIVTGVLILKVTANIISNYANYYPPNFHTGFLQGRERDFQGAYPVAFYAHIVSGPISLALGLILVSKRARAWSPRWHRILGWISAACVLFLVTPSGLWMARYAASGPIASVALATLSVATATCVAMGVYFGIKRRFAAHRRWMWRCYILLCSSVVLRLMGGLATVFGVTSPWYDPLATWLCWLVPLAGFERLERMNFRKRRRPEPTLSHNNSYLLSSNTHSISS